MNNCSCDGLILNNRMGLFYYLYQRYTITQFQAQRAGISGEAVSPRARETTPRVLKGPIIPKPERLSEIHFHQMLLTITAKCDMKSFSIARSGAQAVWWFNVPGRS